MGGRGTLSKTRRENKETQGKPGATGGAVTHISNDITPLDKRLSSPSDKNRWVGLDEQTEES